MKQWRVFCKNKGACIGLAFISLFLFVAIFAPLIAPHDAAQVHDGSFRVPPFWFEKGSMSFLLGTDDLGRDLLSRLISGARISLFIGFAVVAISASFGTILGLLAGYCGSWVESIIMRMVDILMALPSMLMAIVVVSILGPSLVNAVLAVGIVAIPPFIRLVRASTIDEKSKEYVLASDSLGVKPVQQIFKHILPNCMAPIIIQSTLGFSEGILSAAALGFLGLGAQAPTAEWGTMLSDSRSFIESASWLVTMPGLCILLVVLGFNLFGDGLRDALDPRLKT